MNQPLPAQKRSRLTLILLLGVFILPIVTAYLFHKNKSWIPSTTKSHGTIISPAVPIKDFRLSTTEGKTFTLKDMQHKWSYIYVSEGSCNNACQLTLAKMRNARLAQGGEAQRVNYYLLFTGAPEEGLLNEKFKQEHPKLLILQGQGGGLDNLLAAFKQGVAAGSVTGRVYMVDPIGNYMMYYEDGFDSLGIMEDLKHLLKASQIG